MLHLLINERFVMKLMSSGRMCNNFFRTLSRNKLTRRILVPDMMRHFTSRDVRYQKVEELKFRKNSHREFRKKLEISGVSITDLKDTVTVKLENSVKLHYPVVWLRDNCRCNECFEPISKSRVIDFVSFRIDSEPSDVRFDHSNLYITWDDGHISVFSSEWLLEHSFDKDHQLARHNEHVPQQTPWESEDFDRKPTTFQIFHFSDIMTLDTTLLDWLLALAEKGVAVIKGAPVESGQVKLLAERVAFLKRTHYGTEFFVQGVENAANVAYKTGSLQMHTDLPYYNYAPGIILLHCIVNSSEGGENILSDGLNAIKQLDANQLKVLTQTVVDWIDIGSHEGAEFYSINRSPVLCFDHFGRLRINWSQPQRDSVFNIPIEKTKEWYRAVKNFSEILHHKRNAVILKTEPGDILTFDNHRILHGRMYYKDGSRLLSGGYIDWDEIYSRIRVLKKQLRRKD